MIHSSIRTPAVTERECCCSEPRREVSNREESESGVYRNITVQSHFDNTADDKRVLPTQRKVMAFEIPPAIAERLLFLRETVTAGNVMKCIAKFVFSP